MKNLKKVLALALAIALSLTMFAGAAFTDQEEINKTEAVDTLVALGVINGMPDGSFNPDGNVTRAEMAKMIYAVRMRGNTDAGNFAGLSTSFTDLYDTWYRGYVKWAQAAGIIDGKSATTFDPNGSVTGTEAAKMLLVLAGYTSDRAGLTGVNWETNTIRYASQAGLLDNMDNVDLSQALPREYAAQLIYNALFTPMVRWSNDSESFEELTNKDQAGDSGNNEITTIGLQYMDLRFYEGTFAGNYKTGAPCKDGEIVIGDKAIEYDLDLSWIGEEVEVLYQDNNLKGTTATLDKDDIVYGITKTGDTAVYNITKDDLQDANSGKIKFGGVNYSAAASIDVYINYVEDTDTSYTAANFDKGGSLYQDSADTIKFVTNDEGEIATAYIIDKTVSQIVSLSSDKVTLRGAGVKDIEDDSVVLYDGAAKDDYVYYAELYENDSEIVVEKATVLEDQEVTAIKGDEITIDGTAYGKSAETNNTDMTSISGGSDMTAGDKYDVVLYGTRWVAADATEESYDDYALVLGAEDSTITGLTVKLLLADNTTRVVSVDEDYEAGIVDKDEGIMVGYTIDEDNVAKLYAVDKTSTDYQADYDKASKTLTYGASDKAVTASGAVAFLKDDDDEWKAYSADSLDDQTASAAVPVYTATKSGKLVAFAFDLGKAVAGAGGDDLYGWVVDDASSLKDYKTLPVWNGEETIEVRFDSSANLAGKKGTFVKIEDFNAEKEYAASALVNIDGNAASLAALAAGAEDKFTKIDSFDLDRNLIVLTNEQVTNASGAKTETENQGLTLADDYVIIGIDRENEAIYEDATLQEYTDIYGEDYNNVLVVTNSDGEVIVIFIDVNNNINNTGKYSG